MYMYVMWHINMIDNKVQIKINMLCCEQLLNIWKIFKALNKRTILLARYIIYHKGELFAAAFSYTGDANFNYFTIIHLTTEGTLVVVVLNYIYKNIFWIKYVFYYNR